MLNILAEARTDLFTTGVIEIPSFLMKSVWERHQELGTLVAFIMSLIRRQESQKHVPGIITLEKDGKMTIVPGMKSETKKMILL